MKHLYISDLDGTLFSGFEGFEPKQREHLRRLLVDHDAAFTFATARVVPSGLTALGNPPIKLPMIGCGGAVLQAADGQVLHERLLAADVVAAATRLFQELGLGMTLILSPRHGHRRHWWTPQGFNLMDSFIASHWQDASFVKLEAGEKVEELDCVGVSCCGPRGSLEAVRQLSRQFDDLRLEIVNDPYQSGVDVGFVQDDRANKGEAVRLLCQHLGLPLGPERVTVFGDAHNDLSMFDLDARKVAVDVAVPELKAKADVILGPEMSVLEFIERELAQA